VTDGENEGDEVICAG